MSTPSTSAKAGASGVDLKATRRGSQKMLDVSASRQMPHSIEAEQGVLGCCMIDAKCLDTCQLEITPESFYDLRHRAIYEAMQQLLENKKRPDDLIALQAHLKDAKLLDQVGGIPYLSALADFVPSAANLTYYLDIVREKTVLRNLVQTCSGVVGRVYDFEGDVDSLLDEVEKQVLSIRKRKKQRGPENAKELVAESLVYLENLMNQTEEKYGDFSTGLIDLDRVTDGMSRHEMILVGAFPSVGKTAFAMGIAIHNVLSGNKVAVLTLEMSPTKLMIRSILAQAGINRYDIRDKKVSEADFDNIFTAANSLAKTNLKIVPCNGFTIGQIQAEARRVAQEFGGIDIFIFDYLGLASDPKADTREQEIAKISSSLKNLCAEHNSCVIVLTQLTETQKGVRIRDSAGPGQDADKYWQLENDGDKTPYLQKVRLNINKGRDGEAGGFVNLIFRKTVTRFECPAKDLPGE